MNPTEKYPPEGFDMIGKKYKLISDNPFDELYCTVKEVRKNSKGESWVRYELPRNLVPEAIPLSQFKQMWKEV